MADGAPGLVAAGVVGANAGGRSWRRSRVVGGGGCRGGAGRGNRLFFVAA